jgi:hypothetical protein
VAAGATEVETVDADRKVAETLGPGAVRAQEVWVQQSVAEVTGGSANMVFMWYGAKVMWRIWMSLKLRAYFVILSTTRSPISFFGWPCWSRGVSTGNA